LSFIFRIGTPGLFSWTDIQKRPKKKRSIDPSLALAQEMDLFRASNPIAKSTSATQIHGSKDGIASMGKENIDNSQPSQPDSLPSSTQGSLDRSQTPSYGLSNSVKPITGISANSSIRSNAEINVGPKASFIPQSHHSTTQQTNVQDNDLGLAPPPRKHISIFLSFPLNSLDYFEISEEELLRIDREVELAMTVSLSYSLPRTICFINHSNLFLQQSATLPNPPKAQTTIQPVQVPQANQHTYNSLQNKVIPIFTLSFTCRLRLGCFHRVLNMCLITQIQAIAFPIKSSLGLRSAPSPES
jgi:hypothetical protein